MLLTHVKKRNGDVVPFDPTKLNKWAEWACAGLNVDWSDIALRAIRSLPDYSSTQKLQEALIRACIDKEAIAENDDLEKVAARLMLADIRKEVFGEFTPPTLASFYTQMVEAGLWEDMGYDLIRLNMLEKYIDHSRDDLFTYSGLRQFCDKYGLKNRVTNRLYETPQFAMMGIAMCTMRDEPLADLVDTYNMLTEQVTLVNLPTPYLIGLRTPHRGFASCCLISGGDDKNSIAAAIQAAYTMTANRAGIGFELETRTIGDPVKGGLIVHMGKLPYYRHTDTAVKANSQQARGGSATVHFSVYDPQFEDLIRLKSQRVSHQSSIPFMDYSVGINDFFLRKAAKREEIMLVSYLYAPELYDAQRSGDEEHFAEVYNRILHDESIPKKFINAFDACVTLYTQRPEVGRIYAHRLDEMNRHTPFKDVIRMSNLCQEIALPTVPYNDVPDLYDPNSEGEIALCFLASIVAGRIPDDKKMERVCYLTLKLIDWVIDNAYYPFASMERHAKARRSVGVGITNLAHYLASNRVRPDSEEARNLIHKYAERQSYFLHKASLQLAKEKGVCEYAHRTKYPDGWTHLDTYCKEIDKYHSAELQYDWAELSREIVAVGGLRHSVLEAIAPTESSSVYSCTTNGIDLIRQKMVFKSSRMGDIPTIVPDYEKFKEYYVSAWDTDMKYQIMNTAIIQKFTGQSVSFNEYYDYSKYPNRKLPMKVLLQNFFFAAKVGVKTWYYLNSKIGQDESVTSGKEEGCEGCTI